jgi:hypothetical protein
VGLARSAFAPFGVDLADPGSYADDFERPDEWLL